MATHSQAPELTFTRWAVLLCAVLNFSLGLSLPVAMSSLFLDWQDAFQVSRAHTVAVHSTAVGIVFGGAIIPGYLTNRFGARFTILAGTFLASTGCFISCFATSVNYLIASVGILGGLGFCFIQLPSMPVVSAAFPDYGSIVVSLCTIGSALFNMGLPYLYRHLVRIYSWRGTFAFISGLSMQAAVTGFIMTSQTKTSSSHRINYSHADVELELEASFLPPQQKQELPESNSETVVGECEGDEDVIRELVQGKDQMLSSFTSSPDEKQSLHDATSALKNNSNKIKNNNTNTITVNSWLSKLKNSKWKFLVDFLYILIMCHIAGCLAVQYSFVFIIMDFARTKGFPDDSTGTLFILVVFSGSLVGRLVMGPLNLVPRLHSIVIMGVFGGLSSLGMLLLGGATEYVPILAFLTLQAFGIGGVVAIYPKCILDLKTIDVKNYPLALGLACSLEGVFDFLVPILIGYAVDTTGSYTQILHVFGSISLIASIAVVVIKTYMSYTSTEHALV